MAEKIKDIDFSKNLNILCALDSYELKVCNIIKMRKLGAGSQGSVFEAKIEGYETFPPFVDKYQEVINNEKIEQEKLTSMLREFSIAEKLNHPNIIKYHYFVRKYIPEKQKNGKKGGKTEFHLLIE